MGMRSRGGPSLELLVLQELLEEKFAMNLFRLAMNLETKTEEEWYKVDLKDIMESDHSQEVKSKVTNLRKQRKG